MHDTVKTLLIAGGVLAVAGIAYLALSSAGRGATDSRLDSLGDGSPDTTLHDVTGAITSLSQAFAAGAQAFGGNGGSSPTNQRPYGATSYYPATTYGSK